MVMRMLDFRHETFYQLCRWMNYTKTAEAMHVTQPTVSQHIRYLEALYGGPLFVYSDKRLSFTEKGKRLYARVQSLRADTMKVTEEIRREGRGLAPVRFGATLTIGEYVMPRILGEILRAAPEQALNMTVENTEKLLAKLEAGAIDFALLEGYFDKSHYRAERLSIERFIPVCAPQSDFAGRVVAYEEITHRRLILREKGSGTREVLEQALKAHNQSVDSFIKVCVISNMSAIKQLVAQDLGISFMYRAAADPQIRRGELAEFAIEGFNAAHEFNFVFLKTALYEDDHRTWFERIRRAYRGQEPDADHL